ncbi:MAG: fibronectin type III domain-containing protein, partial [Nanoarchaeota archaeon]|nr:fibronectin type III domain-containing protein [Nanoarchaeota archaeon]
CSFMNDSMPWTEWAPCPTSPDPLYPEINWALRSGASGIRTVSVKVNTSFSVVRESNDSIIYDPEPPTGSIDIWAINVPGIQEANNHTTAYTTVSLKLIYNDNDEIAGCRFANDENLEANFTAWQSCTTPKTWILNDEDGNRTVYYQIKDYAGNIFEANDTISLDKTGAGQDTTHPSAATVIDDGMWTNDSTRLHAIWSGAYDPESEILNIPLIYEYSIGTSQGAIDVVGWTSVETNTEMTHTGLNLVDGQIYYINIRVINSAGLTNESSSNGITVDTVPCQITSLSSSTHDNGNWTNNSQSNNPQFSWAGDVSGSGVYGYSYVLDFNSATLPDTIPEGDYEDLSGETSIRYDNIIDGKLNFHVRCRDNAGNWGDEEDSEHFAVWIDASPPPTPQMTEHEITTAQANMTFNWTESIEPHSYNVTYEFELYNHSIFNDTYLVNRTNRTLEHITIFNLTSGMTYYPRVRAWNRAELHSSWSSEVSTIIDYLGPDISIITPGDGCNVSSLSPVIRAETNEWAICSFKDLSVPTAGFIDFDYTSSEYHESRVNVNATDAYIFNISCLDTIGNSADVSRAFTADPGIPISFNSISLESQYYIGFTTGIPLELGNNLGGVSYSDFAVSIDNENLSSDKFGITDLGCGDY